MGSISLPALGIHPPQQPDLLGQVAKVRQIQGMAQEQQLRGQQIQESQLDLQMKQRQMQDQQTIMQVAAAHNGSLLDALPELAGKISAASYIPLQKGIIETQKAYSDKKKTDLENEKAMSDQMLGLIQQAKALPPDQYQQAFPQIAARALQIDPRIKDHVNPAQPIPQQALDGLAMGYATHTQLAAMDLEKRQVAEQAAKLPGEQAESQLKQMQLQSAQQGGAVPGVPLDVQEANSWLKNNPGKTLADYKKYASTLVPAFNFNMQNAGTTGDAGSVAKRFGMTPTAFDQAAEKYWTSGVLPPSGRGGPALALNKAIMNRTGELHPDGSLAANSAEYKANADSLKKIQSNFDQVTAFENTAGKNLDVFLKTAEKVVDSGSPWVNKPLRMIDSGALGSQDQAAFNAARQTAVTEIAKVLNSSNASGVLSDSARHEVEGLIGPNASLKQIVSAANVLKQDMANRHQAYSDQIGDIKGRMGGRQTKQPNTPAPQSGGGNFFSGFGGTPR